MTNFIIASTPALAAAEGTTNPEPCWVYVVVIAKNEHPTDNHVA